MRFWDSSALVPVFVPEADTARVERWMRQDDEVVVWTLTRVELLSALARLRRSEVAAAPTLAVARRDILDSWPRWLEITALELVRGHAERLVQAHPLRAADALQIAAAFVAASDEPGSLEFVTLDARQAEAAAREGFRVLR